MILQDWGVVFRCVATDKGGVQLVIEDNVTYVGDTSLKSKIRFYAFLSRLNDKGMCDIDYIFEALNDAVNYSRFPARAAHPCPDHRPGHSF